MLGLGVYSGINEYYNNHSALLTFFLITVLLLSLIIPSKAISAPASESACNCVVFRLTGLQDYFVNEAQLAIMDLFLKKNQSLALGLIMNDIGQDQNITDKVLEGSNRGLFELAINGWNFTDYSNLSESIQQISLIRANEKMRYLFDVTSQIFIPPYESYNASTVDAMHQANMTVLSSNIGTDIDQVFTSSEKNASNTTNQTIYHLPATTSFSDYNTTGDVVKVPLQKLQNDINANIDKYGYAVINLDPQFFGNETENQNQVTKINNQELSNLSSLIDYLISNNIDITTFSKITGTKTNIPVIQNRATNISSNKGVVLAFDDGWESQYTIAKPILDKYGFKATFFTVCNYVGKDIDGKRMDWADIESLHNDGQDIQSHTMNHANLSKVSKEQLDLEVSQSKQCLLDRGINSTIFAYPMNEGSHNETVVNAVTKHYELARTGEEPLMYLHCDGWKGISNQTDCKTYFDNGTLTFVNRYSIPGWTHNSHASSIYNGSQMFQKFVDVVNSQVAYNKKMVRAIPIITYHNITYQNVTEYDIGTLSIDKDLFEAEMKYLYDNHFRVLTMADLGYDEYNNNLYLEHLYFNNESKIPQINDPSLKAEVVVEGLQSPTKMAFLGPNDILVLEKDNGTVRRIINGSLLQEPLLDVDVANENERGMLGIAIKKNESLTNVFLYYTEAEEENKDVCPTINYCEKYNEPLGNHLYKYDLINNKLANPKLLLNLTALPGPGHNGGALAIGPDNNLYVTIGDIEGHETQSQNSNVSLLPDGTSGILRITQDGQSLLDGPFGDNYPLNLYYAYGIRNSFGIDFDPLTGNMWDTENGPSYADEINLVEPGFNSGWKEVQGMSYLEGSNVDDLVNFDGRGKYSDPEFAWYDSAAGPTALKFFASDKLGKKYQNDIFVSDFHNGYIYHFGLNKNRGSLFLSDPLNDRVSNTNNELDGIIFGTGFGGISDLQVGPDGYLYVLSINEGTIFRIAND